MDVTNFTGFHFGECICLYKDFKSTIGMIKLLTNPPGWYPDTKKHTAIVQKKPTRSTLLNIERLGFIKSWVIKK